MSEQAVWPGPMPEGFEPLYQYMCDQGYTIDPGNLVRQSVGCVLRDLELARYRSSITTDAELDALPIGSVVMGRSVWKRIDAFWWRVGWERDYSSLDVIGREADGVLVLHRGQP